jgi:two-component system response regulator RegX3
MTSRKPQILVIEDEEAIRNGLIDVLLYHGYRVDSAANGPLGLEKALTGKFDMILLDVMLPGMDGFQICNQIRESDREQAIIMLTAKSDDDDIIHGLRLGADDYVSKPFSIAQLVLRIQAVLRRSRHDLSSDSNIQLSTDDVIDVVNMSGRCAGNNVAFTRREMDVLTYLNSNNDRPVPRDELLNKIWGYAKNLDLETRTVDIHIAKIRRKIENNPAVPQYLITVRGAGYRLQVR